MFSNAYLSSNYFKTLLSRAQFNSIQSPSHVWLCDLMEQHARPSDPPPTPGVSSNSCPLTRWCHSTISSFVVPFSSCLQSFSASGSFQMSQFFASGCQSIGFSFTISPSNEYSGLISLGLTGLISLQSKGLSRVFSNTTVQKHQFLVLSFLYSPSLTSIHDYWKNHSFD